MDELITYMGYLWIQVEGEVLTIGINDSALEEFSDITKVDLPVEGSVFEPDEVCGELETDQGPLNLYCPVDGKVIEINETAVQNPSVIQEDPYGDGWLFRIEAESADQVESLASDTNDGDDDDEDFDDRNDEE